MKLSDYILTESCRSITERIVGKLMYFRLQNYRQDPGSTYRFVDALQGERVSVCP